MQLAAIVVEPEDQRADRSLLLPGTPTDDDTVDRANPFDLHHADPLTWTVRSSKLFRDDTLRALQPAPRLRSLARRGCERQRVAAELFEVGSPFFERAIEQQL